MCNDQQDAHILRSFYKLYSEKKEICVTISKMPIFCENFMNCIQTKDEKIKRANFSAMQNMWVKEEGILGQKNRFIFFTYR
jgi:hypothetical protein